MGFEEKIKSLITKWNTIKAQDITLKLIKEATCPPELQEIKKKNPKELTSEEKILKDKLTDSYNKENKDIKNKQDKELIRWREALASFGGTLCEILELIKKNKGIEISSYGCNGLSIHYGICNEYYTFFNCGRAIQESLETLKNNNENWANKLKNALQTMGKCLKNATEASIKNYSNSGRVCASGTGIDASESFFKTVNW